MVSVINPLAAEYANDRRRDFSVTLMNLGFPLGGVLGGVIAAALLPHYGWRRCSSPRACWPSIMLAVVAAVSARAASRPARPAARGRRWPGSTPSSPNVASRFSTSLPPHVAPRSDRSRRCYRQRPRDDAAHRARLLSLRHVGVLYPELGADPGRRRRLLAGAGGGASVVLNLGGIAGGLLLGLLVPLIGLRRVVVAALLLTAAGIVLFGIVPPTCSRCRRWRQSPAWRRSAA